MGRPTKYNEPRAKIILDLLRDGCTRRAAYGSANVDAATFARWQKVYPEFAEGVTRAEADAEARFTQSLYKAATGYDSDWRAAEAWLKRRRRDEWGDNINLNRLSDDDLIALATGGLPGGRKAEDPA